MDRGHIPSSAYGQVLQSGWAAGAPETRRFLGGITFREGELIPCARCAASTLRWRDG